MTTSFRRISLRDVRRSAPPSASFWLVEVLDRRPAWLRLVADLTVSIAASQTTGLYKILIFPDQSSNRFHMSFRLFYECLRKGARYWLDFR